MLDKRLLLITLISFILIIGIAGAYISGISYANIRIQGDTIFDGQGKLWLIDWTGGGTDSIEGTINKAEFEEYTDQRSEQDFSIKMDSEDEYGKYTYEQRFGDKDLQKVELIEHIEWWSSDHETIAIDLGCVDFDYDGNIEYSYNTLPVYTHVRCAKWGEKEGNVFSIHSKKGIFTTNWVFSAVGKEEERVTLTNENNIGDGSSTSLGDVILIKWKGNLAFGTYLPEYSNFKTVHSNDYGWKIVDEDIYDNYLDYLETELDDCIFGWARGWNTKDFCEQEVNVRLNKAQVWTSSTNFPENKVDFEDGFFKLDTAEQILVPTFQMFIDADYLEIVISTGRPQITSLSSPIFVEGEPGKITANVKNIGDGRGDFELRISSCSSGFDPTSIVYPLTLNPGESRSVDLDISGSSDSTTQTQISGTCTVDFKEKTTQRFTTKSVSVKYNQQTECNPGNEFKTIVNGVWVVKRCNTDGLTTTTILTCAVGETVDLINGQWECLTSGSNGGGAVVGECPPIDLFLFELPNIPCLIGEFIEDLINGVLTFLEILAVVISLLVFLISMFVLNDYADTKSRKKKKGPTVWIFITMISLVLAVLAYLTWWIGLILFVAFLIIKRFIPKI